LKGRSPFKNHSSPSPLKERGIKGVRLINWSQIEEYVSQLPHQQDARVPKESVVHPQSAGYGYSLGAWRKTVPDGRAIDIKEDGDYWHVHWDKYNPSTYLIEHALCDAPVEWLLTAAGIGAVVSSKGKKGEGALKGLAWGLGLGLLLKAILSKN